MSENARAALRGLPMTEQTVPRMLIRQADAYRDRTLVRTGAGEERSYVEVRDEASRWGAMLDRAGVARGDRVVAMCANRLELLHMVLGCAWIGAIAVPVNTAMRGTQLSHVLGNAGARFMMIEASLVPALEMVPAPAALRELWVLDGPVAAAPEGYRCVLLPERDQAIEPAEVGPGDTMAILYTSGTTGLSKGVLCPHAQFYWWGILTLETLGIREGDVLMTCLPMFHTNSLHCFFQALLSGSTYAVLPRFSASRFWEQAADHKATVTYLLGAMVNILYGRPPGPQDSAHTVRIALAGATPAGLHEPFLERFGVQLVDGWGSTETNSVLGFPLDQLRPGYMGWANAEFETAVVDEFDHQVQDGTPGELVLRPREPFSISSGYHEMPQATVQTWRNLWFHTGDRVVREADGCFRFVDRIKDAIRRRGENISSVEVESVLLDHPAVKLAAVFPVPSELAEDDVMATVVLEDGASLEPVDLIRFCEPRLAYFAIPRYVDIVGELPLTENGKVRKVVLRERAITPTAWDRERAGYKLSRA